MTIHFVGDGGRGTNYFMNPLNQFISGIGGSEAIAAQTFASYNSTIADRISNFATGPGSLTFTEGDTYYLVYCPDQADILADRTSSQIIADLEDYFDLAIAKGYSIICTTFLPGDANHYTETQEATRQAANALILASTLPDFKIDLANTPDLSDGTDTMFYAADLQDFNHAGCIALNEAITRAVSVPGRLLGGVSYYDTQYNVGPFFWCGGFRARYDGTASHIWLYASAAGDVHLTVFDGTVSGQGSNLLAHVGPVTVSVGINVFALAAPLTIEAGTYYWLGGIANGVNAISRYEGGFGNMYVDLAHGWSYFDENGPTGALSLNANDAYQISIGLAYLPDTGDDATIPDVELVSPILNDADHVIIPTADIVSPVLHSADYANIQTMSFSSPAVREVDRVTMPNFSLVSGPVLVDNIVNARGSFRRKLLLFGRR